VHNQRSHDDGDRVGYLGATADEVTCHQFVELVTDYFEGALPPRTLGQVEEHLVMCDWCVTYAEQMRATVDSLRMLRDRRSPTPSGSVLAALRARRAAGQ
jgi:predicted anti-sigma-YlaC factor YlaD